MNRCEGCNSDLYECNVCDFCQEHYYCDCEPCPCEYDRWNNDDDIHYDNEVLVGYYHYWKHESFGGYSE